MADNTLGQDVMGSISKPVRSVYERVTHFFGDPSAPASPAKAPQMNWTPEPNEEQKKAIEDRDAETKPLSQRKLGGKNRPAIKKPAATNQTQRKQP